MPNRLTEKQHKALYRFIAQRDGDQCIFPGCPRRPLQIDEADNDPTNWDDPDNVHLVCQRHNLYCRGRTTREHQDLMRRYSALRARERARESDPPPKKLFSPPPASCLDLTDASAQIRINAKKRPVFEDFVINRVRERVKVEKEDLIACACLRSQVNEVTGKRYMKPLLSSDGPLQESEDGGVVYITLRQQRPPATGTTHGGPEGGDEGA